MWKQKIGISLGNNYTAPTSEVIRLVGKIGFDAISLVWKKDVDMGSLVTIAREQGLTVQSLHAPFDKSAALWSSDPSVSEPAKEEILSALDICAQWNIPILVVHTWIGFDYTFCPETLNYETYEEIVSYAGKRNIKVAFENTEGDEYFFALMEHFKDTDVVGFCWDSGHELCYNHSQDLLAKFGDRLLITHLNDNLGISRFDGKVFWTDDLHLLPFDGISDWEDNIRRMAKAQPLDILNFELGITSKPNRHENDIYAQMSLELYFTEAYKRACRIAYKYAQAIQ